MPALSSIGQFVIGSSPIQGTPVIDEQTLVQEVIPSYLYREYADDDDLQGFIDAYNAMVQQFIDWFTTLNLPVYTGNVISGGLLDWVALGLYGMPRPLLSSGTIRSVGPLNTAAFNTLSFNGARRIPAYTYAVTTDDVFKRCLTWNFYKGDGHSFSINWLKRRVLRFLLGANGTAPAIDETYPISVEFQTATQVSITITGNYDLNVVTALQEGVASGVLQLPFQFQFTVSINGPGTGFGLFAFGVSSF